MQTSQHVPTETPAEIYAALAAGRIILLDVREGGEYAAEHIAGARLCPLSTFDPSGLPAEEGKALIFHCGSGKRSEAAWKNASAAGVNVRGHMAGGIEAWKAAGLPVVGADTSVRGP